MTRYRGSYWKKQIKVVVRREQAAGWAIVKVIELLDTASPTVRNAEPTLRADLKVAADRIEQRVFTEVFFVFEAALREAYRHQFGRPTTPRMSDLLEAVRALAGIPVSLYEAVDNVRELRNEIVHAINPAEATVSVPRNFQNLLLRFLSHIPNWSIPA